jgi:hypothetical protein
MTNARMTHYQGLLLDAPHILFSKPVSLNPATLLPNPDLKAPLYDCQEIIAEITQVHPNLQDLALPNSELVWYTDGVASSWMGCVRRGQWWWTKVGT